VGILGTALLSIYSGTTFAIFIEIGLYLTEKEQKISWHSFFETRISRIRREDHREWISTKFRTRLIAKLCSNMCSIDRVVASRMFVADNMGLSVFVFARLFSKTTQKVLDLQTRKIAIHGHR